MDVDVPPVSDSENLDKCDKPHDDVNQNSKVAMDTEKQEVDGIIEKSTTNGTETENIKDNPEPMVICFTNFCSLILFVNYK